MHRQPPRWQCDWPWFWPSASASRWIAGLAAGHWHDVVDWGQLFMGILSIIGTIVVGLIVGVLARTIFPVAVPLGFWLTVGLGIGGSVVGGVIADLFLRSPDGRLHPAGWLLSIAGAVLLLWGYTNYMM